MRLPDGYYPDYGSALAARRIDEGIAENEEEVREIFRENAHRIQRVRCAYCDRRVHTTRQAAVRWFAQHDCITTHDSLTCACVLGEAA